MHRFGTLAVHAGEERFNQYDSITTPIVQTSTFIFHDVEHIRGFATKTLAHHEYGRYGNPTQEAAERKIAALEGARDAILFASGMNAITTALLALLRAGDHMILTDDAYKKTIDFVVAVLPRFGIESTIVKMGDYGAMEAAIRPNTKIFFSESPTNPYLNIMDMERVVKIFRPRDITVISDSTFATPFNQRPLEFGVDLVIHSATKYLGGHNDLLAGAVLGSKVLIETIRQFRRTTGGVIDPLVSYLLIRGLKTFHLRMRHMNASAQRVAEFLEAHPRVKRVYYPGLPSHPHHDIAKAQMKGFGGVVTFEADSDMDGTLRFLETLKLFYIGPSFGGVEALVTHPATISYYDCTREERLALGITDGLVRLAVGAEDAVDVIEDLDQALAAM
jgi:cystathionine gamma-synthase